MFFCDACDVPLCQEHGVWYESTEAADCGGACMAVHVCKTCEALGTTHGLQARYGLDRYDGGDMDKFIADLRCRLRD